MKEVKQKTWKDVKLGDRLIVWSPSENFWGSFENWRSYSEYKVTSLETSTTNRKAFIIHIKEITTGNEINFFTIKKDPVDSCSISSELEPEAYYTFSSVETMYSFAIEFYRKNMLASLDKLTTMKADFEVYKTLKRLGGN